MTKAVEFARVGVKGVVSEIYKGRNQAVVQSDGLFEPQQVSDESNSRRVYAEV